MYKKIDNFKKQEIIDSLKIKPKFTIDKIVVVTSSRDVKKWKVVDRITLK